MGKNVEYQIRGFRKSDLDDLLRLLPICNAEEFSASGFDPDHVKRMVNRLYGWSGRFLLGLMQLLGKKPFTFFVAEADGKLVGTTIVENRGGTAWISAVMVDPDYRRRGIAMRLMINALKYIRANGKTRAALGVLSTNAPAIDLYSKLGFRAFEHTGYFVGETKSFIAPQDIKGLVIRRFRNSDLEEVYQIVLSSEDATRLKMYDFRKRDLKTQRLGGLLRSSSSLRFVAVYDRVIVGYAEASSTTAREVARIGLVHANTVGRSLSVESLLIDAARKEVEKTGVNRFRIIVPATQPGLMEAVKALGFREAFAVDGMVSELSKS